MGRTPENWKSPKLAPILRTLVVLDEKFGSILRDVQRENRSGTSRNPNRLAPGDDICIMPTVAL